jgi:hypothetical protein
LRNIDRQQVSNEVSPLLKNSRVSADVRRRSNFANDDERGSANNSYPDTNLSRIAIRQSAWNIELPAVWLTASQANPSFRRRFVAPRGTGGVDVPCGIFEASPACLPADASDRYRRPREFA